MGIVETVGPDGRRLALLKLLLTNDCIFDCGYCAHRRSNDIERASFTVHPNGIPHGPHPGTYEGSIGKEKTEELAVMVDTFHTLKAPIVRRASS